MKLLVLQVLVIIMLLLIIMNFVKRKYDLENFVAGYGSSFSYFYIPRPLCTSENNCFRGFTDRGGIYTNICEPKIPQIPGLGGSRNGIDEGRLLRAPRPSKEECIRML